MTKTWITIVGSSPFAVINTAWAACRVEDYVPERVVLITNSQLKPGDVSTVRHWLGVMLKEYGIESPEFVEISVEESDFSGIMGAFVKAIGEASQKGEVAIDMTPGRKYMSAIAMYSGILNDVDHIYYLHLLDNSYQNSPYSLIPLCKNRLSDIKNYHEAGVFK